VATWRDLVRYIHIDTRYEIVRESPDEIRILYRFEEEADVDDDIDGGRTQVMVLQREVLDHKEDWVQIATPFARVADVDLATVLEEIALTSVVGGAVIMGEYLVLRHSVPLQNLDANEFEEPLELVASTADQLEEQFVGGDNF